MPESQLEIVIEPLGDHVRGDFCCGEKRIDNFFRNNARNSHDAYAQRIFVARYGDKTELLGFYALTLMTFALGMNEEADAKFGRFNSIPTIYLTMIGRDQTHGPKGIGSVLMEDAFRRCLSVRNNVGAYALTLHAVNERVAQRYEDLGFTRFHTELHDRQQKDETHRAMFYELNAIAAALAEGDAT